MTFRPCRRDEIAEVLALWRADPSATDDPEGVSALIDHDQEALLVAEADGRIVGTLIAAWDGWRGNMYRLAVAPAYRRRRVAAQLIDEGERRLRARGARRVTALVRTEDSALELWQAAGYPYDPRVARYAKTIA